MQNSSDVSIFEFPAHGIDIEEFLKEAELEFPLSPSSPAESTSSVGGRKSSILGNNLISLLQEPRTLSSDNNLHDDLISEIKHNRNFRQNCRIKNVNRNSEVENRITYEDDIFPEFLQAISSEGKDGTESGDLEKEKAFKFSSTIQVMDDDDEAIRKVMEAKKYKEDRPIDAKRAKRIIANRQSAARSKERRIRYISNLEGKISFYEKQSSALKATINALQKEASSMAEMNDGMNKKLKILDILYKQREVENVKLRDEINTLRKFYGASARASDITQSTIVEQANSISQCISPRQTPQQMFEIMQETLGNSYFSQTEQLKPIQLGSPLCYQSSRLIPELTSPLTKVAQGSEAPLCPNQNMQDLLQPNDV